MILLFCGLLTYFLGNTGVITFIIWFIGVFIIYGSYKLVVDDNSIYIFNVGKIPDWICDNYKNKRKFFTELNNDYKNFNQNNKEII